MIELIAGPFVQPDAVDIRLDQPAGQRPDLRCECYRSLLENLKRRCLPHGWPPNSRETNLAEIVAAAKDVYRFTPIRLRH
jgi:hypothetical protein